MTNNGLLRISQGTFNVGIAANESVNGGPNAAFIIEGGTVNVAGRMQLQSALTYTQSGGTVNVCTSGNGLASAAGFAVSSSSATFTMSGGSINLVQACTAAGTPLDYQVNAITNFTGGTLNVGNGATATNFTFRLSGNLPNLVIDNTGNPKSGVFVAASSVFGNTTIQAGSVLNLNGFLCRFAGSTFTNNGILNGTTANSRFYLNGAMPQTYSGSGTVTAPLASIDIDNSSGLTINPAVNQIATLAINLFNGGITNTNKITLGNAGATTGTVQIGNITTPTSPGSLDVPPLFNLGTGGEIVSYLRGSTPRTTAGEIGPTRTLSSITVDDNNIGFNEITIAGGDITLSSTGTALTLTNGRLVTGTNTVILSASSATVSRANDGSVDGNLRKLYVAAGSKIFEVGTVAGYSPVTVNATGGTFPANITAGAHRGRHPNYPSINSLKRYWSIAAPANIPADLTFQYFGSDVFTRNETTFKIVKYSGGFTLPASTVNTSMHTLTVTGAVAPITGDWFVIGEADADFDGMPDSYETAKGFLPNNASDANTDFDKDGMTNLAEYNTGTDPKNAQDYLRITSITKDASGVIVNCSAVDFKSYRLDFKNALTDPAWTFLRFSNPHTGMSTAPLPDVTVGAALRRFYRVRCTVDDQL